MSRGSCPARALTAAGAGESRGVRLAYRLYDAGVCLLVGVALLPFELLRIAAHRTPPAILYERLGRTSLAPRSRRRILIHAVSAGEMAAARALLASLSAADPALSFILTTGNQAGRRIAELARSSAAAVEGASYLPWDRAGALRAWLQALQPAAVVVVEIEIWPGLFRTCGELGIPLFLVSARLSPRDVPHYRLARWFFRHVLHAACWIGAQSEQEREALIGIGAPAERVEVAGNLKLGATAPQALLPEPWLASIATAHPLLVGGSTHDPEESWLVESLITLRADFPSLRLVLAPRRTRRAARLRRQALARGLQVAAWSEPGSAATRWDVLVLDEVGPLAALYRHAEVAFIGGSLARCGGHNPLEAAAQSRAVVIGPSFESFQDAVYGLLQAGAIRVLRPDERSQAALCSALAELLADPPRRALMGHAGAAFCASRRGVSRRYAEAILSRLPRS